MASIIGLACRLPGQVGTPNDLVEMLVQKRSGLIPMPRGRLPKEYEEAYDKAGLKFGCLPGEEIWDVDARYFGMPTTMLATVDPQMRMSLELAAEALYDTGLSMSELEGRKVGVFCAQGLPENAGRMCSGRGACNKWTNMGNYGCLLANSVSQHFNFTGPSMTIDTACSGTLTAVQLAIDSMAGGSCDMAVIIGVNALVSPLYTKQVAEMGVLSTAGASIPFDAAADGFCRAEGAGAVVLLPSKELLSGQSAALPRNRLRIYATIDAMVCNHNGRTASRTEPSAAAQMALIKEGLVKADLQPEQIVYMEMHATSTPLGDPIEAAAVGKGLGAVPGRRQPLLIGAVKSNLGHLESAAGIAGLIKATLAVYYRTMLPTRFSGNWSRKIDHKALNIAVATTTQPLLPHAPGQSIFVGVNSFGIGGSNAFCILREADIAPHMAARTASGHLIQEAAPTSSRKILPAYLVPLSTPHIAQLKPYKQRWSEFGANPGLSLCSLQTPGIGFADSALDEAVRGHLQAATHQMLFRSVLLGPLSSKMQQAQLEPLLPSTVLSKGRKPRIGVCFGGQGTLMPGAGQQLYDHLPAFRSAAAEFSDTYKRISGGSVQLLEPGQTLTWAAKGADGRGPLETADVRVSLPATVLLQYAMWSALAQLGLVPEAAAGHSAGEVMAAYATGQLSREQLCQLIYARAAALAQLPEGSMAAVVGDMQVLQPLLSKPGIAGQVFLAARNAANQVTLGGTKAGIVALLQATQGTGLKAVQLAVQHAFHGPHVAAVQGEFAAELAAAGWAEASMKAPAAGAPLFISSTPGAQAGAALGSAHWSANMQHPVQFHAAAEQLVSKCDMVLEVSPRAVLTSCLAATAPSLVALPLVKKPATELADAFHALGQAYLAGQDFEWPLLLEPGAPAAFWPRYPWKHDVKSWVDTDPRGPPTIIQHSVMGPSEFNSQIGGALANKVSLPDGYFDSYLPAAAATGMASSDKPQRPPTPPQVPASRAIPADGSRPADPAAAAGAPAADGVPASQVNASPAPETPAAAMLLTRMPASTADGAAAVLPLAAEATFTVPSYCGDHVIHGNACVPGASYICWMAQLACQLKLVPPGHAVVVKDYSINRIQPVKTILGDVRMKLSLKSDGSVMAQSNMGGDSAWVPKPVSSGVIAVDMAPLSDALVTRLDHLLALHAQAQLPDGESGLCPMNVKRLYAYLDEHSGYQYGPTFTTVDAMKQHVSKDWGYGRMRVPLNAQGSLVTDTGSLHPAVLDMSTHVSGMLGFIPTKLDTAVPVAYDNIFIWPAVSLEAARAGKVEVVARHIDLTEGGSVAVYELAVIVQGRVAVFMSGVRNKIIVGRSNPATMATTQYQHLSLPQAVLSPGACAWIGPGALLQALVPASRLASDIVLASESFGGSDSAAVAEAVARQLSGVQAVVDLRASMHDAAALLNKLPAAISFMALCLPPLTIGSHSVMAWVRSCRHEQPHRAVRVLTVVCPPAGGLSAPLMAQVASQVLSLAAAGASVPHELVYNAATGALLVPKLVPGWSQAPATAKPPAGGDMPATGPRWRLVVEKPGQLASIGFRRLEPEPLQPGEMRLRIKASGLQFKDVMLAMGLLPGVPGDVCMEMAGTIVEMHPTVSEAAPQFHMGQLVVAVCPGGGIGSYVTVHVSLSTPVPPGMPATQAAGYPSVWTTVRYALIWRGSLQPGETVLIHSALGGVGMAALMLAQRTGCKIIASAGTPAKREALAKMEGVIGVIDSRNASTWLEQVRTFTGGRMVDVLLNSLAGPLQQASLKLMAPGGRFVELGKRDAVEGSNLAQEALMRNVSFVSAHIDLLLADRPLQFFKLVSEVWAGLASGQFPPLPTKVVPVWEAKDAIRTLSRGLHTGKIVLEIPDDWEPEGLATLPLFQPYTDNIVVPDPRGSSGAQVDLPADTTEAAARMRPYQGNGTLVVSGGTSGVGAAFVTECMRQGFKRILVLSSQGLASVSKISSAVWSDLNDQLGATVDVVRCDVRSLEQVSEALHSVPYLFPIQAIIHFATAYVADSTKLPLPSDHPGFAVKVQGAINLHRASMALPQVRSFLMVSSIARPAGSGLQCSYVAANQCLAGIAATRARLGLPAAVVDLPAVSGSGRLAEWANLNELLFTIKRGAMPVHVAQINVGIMRVLTDTSRPGQCITMLHETASTQRTQAGMFAAEGTSTELPADALAVQLPPLHKDAPAGLGQLWNGPAAGTDAHSARLAVSTVTSPDAKADTAVPSLMSAPVSRQQLLAPTTAPALGAAGFAAATAEVLLDVPDMVVRVSDDLPAKAAAGAPPSGAAAAAPAVPSAAHHDHTLASVKEGLRGKLCELLAVAADEIPDHMPLVNLGMDSLSAVELANWSNERFGLPPDAVAAGEGSDTQRLEMLTTMTLAKLAELQLAAIDAHLGGADASSAEEQQTPPPAPAHDSQPDMPTPTAVSSAAAAPAAASMPPAAAFPSYHVQGRSHATAQGFEAMVDLGLPAPKFAPAGTVAAVAQPAKAAAGAPPSGAAAAAPAVPSAAHHDHTLASVKEGLRGKLCELLAVAADEIPDHMPLVNLGMDSLSAVELANWSNERFGLPPDAVAAGEGSDTQRLEMLTTMTLAKLAELQLAAIDAHLGGADASSAEEQQTPPPAPACFEKLAGGHTLAEQQMQALRPTLGTYSIRTQMSGATVLITGASGFVGGMVLEQLLRCTDVAVVYVLLRAKQGCGPQARLKELLSSKLFDNIRQESPASLDRVVAVGGDVVSAGCGLDPSAASSLQGEVEFIIHSAANIRIEAHMRSCLLANYRGTSNVLRLAEGCRKLKALVHLSSAFANMHQPEGPTIGEQIYPLHVNGSACDPCDLAEELLMVPAALVNSRADALMAAVGWPNPYVVSKFMAEHLVDKYRSRGMPCAIVRPSLVTAAAGPPHAGYILGLTGGVTFMLSGTMMEHAWPDVDRAQLNERVVPLCPVDTVAASVLAAAAATAAGVMTQLSSRTPVIHACSSELYPHTFGHAMEIGKKMTAGFEWLLDMVSKSAIPTATLDMRKSTQKSSVEHISAAKHTASNLLQLEAALEREEHQLFPLMWGPRDGDWQVASNATTSGCVLAASVCQGMTWESYFEACKAPMAKLLFQQMAS